MYNLINKQMKKILFGLGMLAASLPSLAADGDLHVKINMKNVGDTLMIVQGKDRTPIVQKNGQFEYTLNLQEPKTVIFATPGTLAGKERKYFQLIAVPNESVEINGDFSTRYDITGSKFYQDYHVADLAMEEASKPLNDLIASLNKRMQAGGNRDQLMKEYQKKAPELEKNVNKAKFDFIKQHAASEASAVLVTEFQNVKDMEEAVSYLAPAVRDGRMKAFYQGQIDRLKRQEEAQAASAKKQAAGVEAPVFTLNDINGKPLSLASLRGKYVILDFWGSWCGWCIKGFPEMKEYYNKYKGKFEILGIDCNDTEVKWKDAVKKHELPWLHVYNPRDSKVLSDYGVTGFPTKIIVGPDGKIVKTIVGEDPAFYTFLDQTFGK